MIKSVSISNYCERMFGRSGWISFASDDNMPNGLLFTNGDSNKRFFLERDSGVAREVFFSNIGMLDMRRSPDDDGTSTTRECNIIGHGDSPQDALDNEKFSFPSIGRFSPIYIYGTQSIPLDNSGIYFHQSSISCDLPVVSVTI